MVYHRIPARSSLSSRTPPAFALLSSQRNSSPWLIRFRAERALVHRCGLPQTHEGGRAAEAPCSQRSARMAPRRRSRRPAADPAGGRRRVAVVGDTLPPQVAVAEAFGDLPHVVRHALAVVGGLPV